MKTKDLLVIESSHNKTRALREYSTKPIWLILEAITAERVRQRQLLREGKIDFDCASPIVDRNRKLRVLGEEYGEVCKAVDLLERAEHVKRPLTPYRARLRAELVQVAAVALAILESLEEK